MSDESKTPKEETTPVVEDPTPKAPVDENFIGVLKAQADLLGVEYHPNIGVDKLAERVNEALIAKTTQEKDPVIVNVTMPETAADRQVAEEAAAMGYDQAEAQRIAQQAKALVRVEITCMNPNKGDWEGEIFSVGNKAVGSIKKYVPFGVAWHVPQMVLDMIKSRKCQVFHTVTDPRTGNKSRKGRLIQEFAVNELPPLTPEELKDLAQRQAMAQGTADAATRH